MYNDDTICALATPAGGAIAVIRVSGSQAIAITDRIFKGRKSLVDIKSNTLAYGNIIAADAGVVDDVLVIVFRAPHSYTGENSTEISCHGSRYIVKQILNLLVQNGCRQALPGEYTQRAYLNGKMDLSQAEAVADLIASTNKMSHHVAISQMRGQFSSELAILREKLLKLTSLLELELDFSDHEELEFADRTELRLLTENINSHISKLAKSFETGQAIKEGIPVAIIGKTNVGKSTLLNCLLHDERAIVSDVHGTTRDSVEDSIEIEGLPFRFIDTAGIRSTSDVVEKIGIERTYQKLAQSQLVIWVVDSNPTTDEINDIEEKTTGKKVILVHNKCDLSPSVTQLSLPKDWEEISISAKNKVGVSELEHLIVKVTAIPDINECDVIITSARQYDALIKANQSISIVLEGLNNNLSGDLLCEDLRIALGYLAEISGEGLINSQEILNNIFKNFCIGK